MKGHKERNKVRTLITAALLAAPVIASGPARAQTFTPAPSLHTPGPGDPVWMTQLRAGLQNNNFGYRDTRVVGVQPNAGGFNWIGGLDYAPGAVVGNQPGLSPGGQAANGFNGGISNSFVGGGLVPGFVAQPRTNFMTPSMLNAPIIPQTVSPSAIGGGLYGIPFGFRDRFGNPIGLNGGFGAGGGLTGGFGAGTGLNVGVNGVTGGPSTFGR